MMKVLIFEILDFFQWRLTAARVPERRRMIAFDTPLPAVC